MSPLVSVLIPMHDSAAWIGDTLRSVLAQTHAPIEIIIADDRSVDPSRAIASALCGDRVRFVQPAGIGAAHARNAALAAARGDYIQYLDADDLLDPNKVRAQVELLEKHPRHVAICQTLQFFDGTEPASGIPDLEKTLLETDDPVAFLANMWGGTDGLLAFVPTHAHLIPRQVAMAAGPWDTELGVDEDGEYFARVLLRSAGVRVARDVLAYYRKFKAPRSLSARRDRASQLARLRSIDKRSELVRSRSDDTAVRLGLGVMYMRLAVASFPLHAGVARACERRIRELGVTVPAPLLGGRSIELLKRAFGWKAARLAQYVRHNLLSPDPRPSERRAG